MSASGETTGRLPATSAVSAPLGSVQPGAGAGLHEGSSGLGASALAKFTSSDCDGPPSAAPRAATLPEAISWRTSLAVIGQRLPSARLQLVLVESRPACSASRAAEYTRPAIPAPSPVALEEQLELGTAIVTFEEKFVQPLNCR